MTCRKTDNNDTSVSMLYGTIPGRILLKIILNTNMDKLAVCFLRSVLSRPYIKRFADKNGIEIKEDELKQFRTYRDFFLREKSYSVDMESTHLISPCDSWLSAFRIDDDSAFSIKGSVYRLCDLIGDSELAKRYRGGDCLIFRLCASDYHHYCYIDDCFQKENHLIQGELHSVQPIAIEKYPVYNLNRRCWCLMETSNFGKVIQAEVGALIVGGIVNHHENTAVKRGTEKGHFDLCGSTVVLFFEKGKIRLRTELIRKLMETEETRVEIGEWIGNKIV